jgi:3,2-trans-enoyl-CoA isomerase
MALKLFSQARKLNFNLTRAFASSSSNNLVLIDVNEKTGYATLSLNKPPVNSLNAEFFLAIADALTLMEKNKTRGVILSSVSSFTGDNFS